MTIEGTRLFSGGFMGELPNRSVAAPAARHNHDAHLPDLVFPKPSTTSDFLSAGIGLAAGSARALDQHAGHPSRPFFETWKQIAYMWGRGNILSETGNKLGGVIERTVKETPTLHRMLEQGWFRKYLPHACDLSYMDYSRILRLQKNVMTSLSWACYKETVQANCSRLIKHLHKQGTHGFFTGNNVTLTSYVKKTLIGNNFKSIKSIFSDDPHKCWGSAIIRSLTYGFMALDILKTSKRAWDQARAREDGSFLSRLSTIAATAKTFAVKTAKSIATWEAGGIGFALGAALFPLGPVLPILGYVLPVGGILAGALGAAMASKGLNWLLPDPPKTPEKPAFNLAAGPRANPFQAATI